MNTTDKVLACLIGLILIGLIFVAFSGNTAHAAAFPYATGGTGTTTPNPGQIVWWGNTFLSGSSGLQWDNTLSKLTATNASTTNLTVATNTYLSTVTSAIPITGTDGLVAEYAGTSCTNQFVRSLSVLGVATCATVSSADVTLANLSATNATLTFSGTYTGATARTIGVNLSNQNNWLTKVGVGTSTPWGILSVSTTTSQTATPLFVVGSSTNSNIPLQVNGFGKIIGTDQISSYTGVISPLSSFGLGTGTTTTWTASTTGSAYSPFLVMPFSGTLQQVSCIPYVGSSAGSFLGVNVVVNGSNATPSYFVASSTVGTETFTAGNTFTKGQTVLANFGTTTTATATSISCTFSATETP